MKVLITGGAGYIGSACTEYFLEHGHEVTVYDNLVEGHREAVDPRAPLVEGDCLDGAFLTRVMQERGIEAVIHLAAFALVGESMQLPGKYFRNNTEGSRSVLDACVAARVRKVVLSSTCATFGIPTTESLHEEHPQHPVNPYGESKLLVEKMLPWYRRIHGLEFVALRYFNAAGATRRFGEHHRIETHLIPNVLKVAMGQSKQCEVYGNDYPTPDGTCLRDYVHIEDLAQAHLLALQSDRSGFYNLGSGAGNSVLEVIRTCERLSGRPIPFEMRPRRAGDPPRLTTTTVRAREELGWRPKYPTLEQIIQTAWDWHQRHPKGYGPA